MDINNEKTAKSMLDLIKELIKQQLDSKDQVALCQIASPGSDGRYNIYVVPDDANVIHGIPNKFGFDLSTGDYVYVYKVGNQFAQSFIFAKVGENLDLREQLSRLEIEGGRTSSSGGSIQGSVVQGPRGEKGDPGNSPYIGINGNWWVGDFDTGVQALFVPALQENAPDENKVKVWLDSDDFPNDATITKPALAKATAFVTDDESNELTSTTSESADAVKAAALDFTEDSASKTTFTASELTSKTSSTTEGGLNFTTDSISALTSAASETNTQSEEALNFTDDTSSTITFADNNSASK